MFGDKSLWKMEIGDKSLWKMEIAFARFYPITFLFVPSSPKDQQDFVP
jgi:hypothetical protein